MEEVGERGVAGVRATCSVHSISPRILAAACSTNKSIKQHNDFNANVERTATLVTPTCSMHRHYNPRAQWFNMSTYRLDLLHMTDHHSVAGDFCASILRAHHTTETEA